MEITREKESFVLRIPLVLILFVKLLSVLGW